MQLSVIIVSYNVKYFLEQCLYSVKAACNNIDAEIFVVDNASSDNTLEYLKPKFPSVLFIKNDLNEGFSKANNKALQLAKGKYILFLNPDTIVAEDSFLNCINFLDAHADAGAAGVRMIDGSGNFLPESKRSFPSAGTSFFKMIGLAALFPRSAIFNRYALGNLDENKTHEADVLPGAFLMARKDVLLRLNGFDEDYFMYAEDIDISYRIQQSGYKNFYLGEHAIIHFKGESMQTNKPGYVKNFYEAMSVFVKKHYKKQPAFFLNMSIQLSRLLASLKHNFSSPKKINQNFNFLLSGDEADTQSAEKILSAHHCNYQKITDLQQAVRIISSYKNPAIIFCTGKILYKETISFIQKNKNKCAYFLHKANSLSIAGSSCRNTAGEIYVNS
jgi:GT2 family glycosyltransferase